MTELLDDWIDREWQHAAAGLLKSVSARAIVKHRPGFGQTVTPVAGSIVASPVLADWDPEPDYFFHWFRDSAIVLDAIRVLHEAGTLDADVAFGHLTDFIDFHLGLRSLDGRALVTSPQWRQRAQLDFVRFLRDDGDLAQVHGDAVYADTRVNPDGTLDLSRWSRPQHDGTPLRALALLRWLPLLPPEDEASAATRATLLRLVRDDLAMTAEHWRDDSFDIWEEDLGQHYYTRRVSAAALEAGARRLTADDVSWGREAERIFATLDEFWRPDAGYIGSRRPSVGRHAGKQLDIATILAAIHTRDARATHSVRDPRMHATLDALERLFAGRYPINRGHERTAMGPAMRPAMKPATRPAMGRYDGDVYFAGGAYFFSTFGAAEFCFLASAADEPGSTAQRDWFARGDGFLQTARAFTPPSGDLAEQFDQRTGEPASARHLAWSYAAFITCIAARRAAATP